MKEVNKNSFLLLIIFIGTLLIRYNQYYIFREFNSDKARQLHGAFNLLNGKGLSYESYDLNNFQPLLQPINEWPPAYSYLTAGISRIGSFDIYTSSVVLDFIAITILWLSLLWMTKLLQFSLLQQMLLFVFLSLSKSVLPEFLSADLLGVALFILSCTLNIHYVKNVRIGKMKGLSFFAAQFIIFFLLIFLKFSLIPAAATIGLSTLLYGESTSVKQFRKSGVILLGLCFLSIALLFLYNKQFSGNSVTLQKVTSLSSFHFQNLALFNPFIIVSLFYFDPLYLRFNAELLERIALIGTLIILTFLFIDIGRKLYVKRATYFESLILTSILAVSGFLILVSLTVPKDNFNGYEWTFVREYRYFAPAILLFLIYAFGSFQLKKHQNFYQASLSVLVGLSMVSVIVLSGYYLLIKNKSTSFDSLYGKVFQVSEYMKKHHNENTYFLSLSNDLATDTEITSLMALNGSKVTLTYSNRFPDSTKNIIFSNHKPLANGKKVVIYYGKNKQVPEKINKANKYWIEKDATGEEFLIIHN